MDNRPPRVEFMKGVILAGGLGTRLRPSTLITNKHLLTVYNKPMIEYPIKTLTDVGCDEIIIVSGGEHIGAFAEYLGSGFTYRVQEEADGIAHALLCVRGLIDGVFPVILGDNYFSETPSFTATPTIYTKEVPDPNRFGVYYKDKIIEKPLTNMGNRAVVGFYVYDHRVFDIIDTLTPSSRGEYEITDVNNAYLNLGAWVTEYEGYWSDLGTFDSLLKTANYIKEKYE